MLLNQSSILCLAHANEEILAMAEKEVTFKKSQSLPLAKLWCRYGESNKFKFLINN